METAVLNRDPYELLEAKGFETAEISCSGSSSRPYGFLTISIISTLS